VISGSCGEPSGYFGNILLVTTASSQQDVFVSFMGRAILFSSFKANLPWGSGNTYDYLYGVGLK